MKTNGIPPGVLAEHGIDPYENSPRRRKICITVIILHILLIALPVLVGYLVLEPEKPLRVIKASLVPPLGDSIDLPPDMPPAADAAPSAPAETPVMPDLAAPKNSTDPVPDLPPPPPPPEPKTPEVKKPEVKKPEVKKPEVKKPEVKKPEVKKPEVKKPEVKKTKKVTAEDILKSRDKDAAKKIEQDRKAAEAEAARAKALADAQAKAEAAMRARKQAIEQAQSASRKRYGSALGDPNSLTPVGDTSDYEDQLKAWLGQRWREPNDTELNGKRPSVQVFLSIAANGTLTRKDFKPCGIEAMDRSVRDMLRDLKAVPKPPRAMDITVMLVVRE